MTIIKFPVKKKREITNLRIDWFPFGNGLFGTQMLYNLNGNPCCARVERQMGYEECRFWLMNKEN